MVSIFAVLGGVFSSSGDIPSGAATWIFNHHTNIISSRGEEFDNYFGTNSIMALTQYVNNAPASLESILSNRKFFEARGLIVRDGYVTENNPARFIDAFVDSLDMERLGFKYSVPKDTGRKPYNPGHMLKLYLYGYLNRIRSSRFLEKATHRNMELIWLLEALRPDFKTIADFRKDNKKPLKKVFREFSLLCRKLDLFGCELIAIDGSKFAANNSNDRNYTRKKLQKLIENIDDKINDYFKQLDESDQTEESVKNVSGEDSKKKIENLKRKKNKYKKCQSDINQSGDNQVSLTDPDSRMMRSRQGNNVCYNVQLATDSKYKLIVTYDVTNEGNDQNQLAPMALAAKKELKVDTISALMDAGYFEKENIRICADENIDCYISRPQKSQNKQKSLFTYRDFKYDSKRDCYWCPAGEKLLYKGNKISGKKLEKAYWTLACKRCSIKSQCTTSKWVRRIYRWEFEDIIEKVEKKSQRKSR